MGNRAVITTSTSKTEGLGIYLHWNGGLESVLAFLDVARERGYRDPAADESYALARLTGVLHEFFGTADSLNIGINTLERLDCDNWDNGVYVIGENWEIIDRWGEGSNPEKTVAALSVRQLEKYYGIKEQLAAAIKEAA